MSKVLTIPEGKIADFITGTFRPDTPEEYVRQNIEKRLVNELKYPKDRIGVEVPIQIGSRKVRCDVVIYAKDMPNTQENIHIIVECKKESVSSNDKKDGIEQLKSYMTACPNCEWGLWTNKKERKILQKITNKQTLQVEFFEKNDIPDVSGNTENIDRPKRSSLVRADGDNLFLAFRRCHESIHVNDGFNKENAFFEFLKIIFCKIRDERNIPHSLDFYVSSTERNSLDGQNACKNRISHIFEAVKKQFSQIFDIHDEIKLSPRSLVEIVGELQGYSFLSTDVDLKGRAYEEIVGSNLKGDRGQFFTPRNVMRMAVKMINPKLEEKVLDPACGTGGFLVMAMNQVIEQLKQAWANELGTDETQWSDEHKKALQQRISEIAQTSFFGFDIAPELVRATKMNMVMNNDGSGNILRNDSLLPPHMWLPEFKETLAKSLGISAQDLKTQNDIALFDVIVTNPPFGSKITIKTEYVLSQYEIGHGWENPKKNNNIGWLKKGVVSSAPPEQLFLERCLQFLKPGGRMAIVCPDNILGAPGLGYIRQWLLSEAKIIASVDLDSDTFQPHTGVQTSILILQKKTEEEKKADLVSKRIQPYNIFMAVIDKVGHDKRGQNTYVRDEEGNEILIETAEQGNASSESQNQRLEKILDDQTVKIPEMFAEWKKEEGFAW